MTLRIIELSGTGPDPTALSFPLIDGKEWLVVNNSTKNIKVGAEGTDPNTWLNIGFGSEKSIHVFKGNLDKLVLGEYPFRTVNACVIEDNSIRAIWNTRKEVNVLDKDGKPVLDKGIPLMTRSGWGEENSNMPPHTVVKVNKNAPGTVIGKWWTSKYAQTLDTHKLVELVDPINPITHKKSIIRDGLTHVKTHLHRDGIDGGHVLLPFASKRFDLNDKNPPDMKVYQKLLEKKIISVNEAKLEVTFTPDNSQWSNYYLIIGGTFKSLVLADPTVQCPRHSTIL